MKAAACPAAMAAQALMAVQQQQVGGRWTRLVQALLKRCTISKLCTISFTLCTISFTFAEGYAAAATGK